MNHRFDGVRCECGKKHHVRRRGLKSYKPTRKPRRVRDKAVEREQLSVTLDLMVAAGIINRTTDGRYEAKLRHRMFWDRPEEDQELVPMLTDEQFQEAISA